MAKFGTNDDLFESSTMTFGEHLEELRTCLVRGAMGLAVGIGLGLFLAQYVVQFFNAPLEKAIIRYKVSASLDRIAQQYPKDTEEAEKNKKLNPNAESGHQHIPPEIIKVITEERLIPEPIYIDVGELVSNLAPVIGQPVGALKIDPWSFSVTDIIHDDYPGLALVLLAAKDTAKDSPAHWLYSKLNPDEVATLELISTRTKSLVMADRKNVVLAFLNRLLGEEGLSSDKAFESLRSSVESTGKDPRQFRRELLVAALPAFLSPPGRKLVSFPAYQFARFDPQALNAQEPFMIWLQAGFITGCVIAGPWIFWQVWNFVAAGLYPHEKRYVHIYLPFSIFLFFCGAALVFLFVLDPVLDFFLGYNRSMGIAPDIRQSEWLGFVLILPLAFGVSFQLPLVMLFLNRIGVVSIETYLSHWRVATLVIFIVSMVLTPTMDPWTMLFMAVPLMFLYVGGLILCKWMPRGKGLFPAAYDP